MANKQTSHNHSLYVADLRLDVTDAVLFEIFHKIGQVTSTRVCRDKNTRRSLGYGYVNYASPNDAQLALDTLNYTEIYGKPCRIMFCQRNPQVRNSNKGCNIFVKNLHKSIDNKMFHNIFAIYGTILSCKLVLNEKPQKTYNYGYIQFIDNKSAQNAIEQLHGTSIQNHKLHIEIFEPRQQRLQREPFTNVYVKNIPQTFDESQLKTLFESETNGTITSMQIWKRDFGVSACLNFETHQKAKLAVEKLNGRQMNTTLKLYVAKSEKRAIRKQQQKKQRKQEKKNTRLNLWPKDANLYIKNLSTSMNDNQLKQLFQRFGKIRSVNVMRESNGKSRGFGFVAYEKKENAMIAMQQMSNVLIDGKPLYISIAQKREQRRNYLDDEIKDENVNQRMSALRYEIDHKLIPTLNQLNQQIQVGQLNQWNITHAQYWFHLQQQKQIATQQINTARLQYKQCEMCIQLPVQNVNMTEGNNDMQIEGNDEIEIDNANTDNGSDVNNELLDKCKLKFRLWLNNTVRLGMYLPVFEQHEYDDVSMIEFFDEEVVVNELGINKKIHSQLILKRVDEFKQSMNEFHKIKQSHQILKQYEQILIKNGIFTLSDLKNDIKTKQDIIDTLGIDQNRNDDIQIILNIISN